jgi:hypothetical protein
MIPIEQTDRGTLIFLKCGCAGWRLLAHPTGTAFLVQIIQQSCDTHAEGGPEHVWSVAKGELVSQFVRTLDHVS